jgi:hypothetical protein
MEGARVKDSGPIRKIEPEIFRASGETPGSVIMKRWMMGLAAALLFTVPSLAATALRWDQLKDPEAAAYEDPFAALSGPELRSLGLVLQLRRRLDTMDTTDADRSTLEQRLRQEEAQLAAAGVQTDLLLSRRFEVATNRAAASLAGNKALVGRDIEITGYVIPVQDPGSDEVITGYLVPEQGMCSHMPAPDPNQMIRYRLSTGWRAEYVYEPVRLTGRLSLKTTRQEITLLDGQVDMIAAFEMEVTGAQSLGEETAPDPMSRIWKFFKGPVPENAWKHP